MGSRFLLTSDSPVLDYAAAKHALVDLTRALALELADQNIRVNAIHATGVETPRFFPGTGNSS